MTEAPEPEDWKRSASMNQAMGGCHKVYVTESTIYLTLGGDVNCVGSCSVQQEIW